LYLIDIHTFVELFAYRGKGLAGYPDFKFGVEVEGSGSFQGESGDVFIGHGLVFYLTAGETLDIDQVESLVGEHKGISDKLKTEFDLLAFTEKSAVLFQGFLGGNLAGIAQYFVKKAHDL